MIERLLTLWAREPARIIGLVVAVLTLLVAFGVEISDEQQQAIIGIMTAIVVILGAELTRSQVYAPASVDDIRAAAAAEARVNLVFPATPTPDDPNPNG